MTAGTSLTAFLASFGGYSPAADSLNDFAPLWLSSSVAATCALLVKARRARDRCFALLLFLPPCATLARIAPEISRPSSTAFGPAVRILQFNVYKNNRTPARIAEWIVAQRPDVIVIEEGLEGGRAVVRKLTPVYPFQVSCLSRMRCSTVILSRMAPLACGGLARGDPENRKAISATWATFPSRGDVFTVVGAHMGHGWPLGDQSRSIRGIADFIARGNPRRTIVVGDFNMTPWSFTMQRQDAAFGLHRVTRALPTWPAWHFLGFDGPPMMPIDHLYLGSDFRLAELRRGPWLGSDHYPLVATLTDAAVPSRMASMKP